MALHRQACGRRKPKPFWQSKAEPIEEHALGRVRLDDTAQAELP